MTAVTAGPDGSGDTAARGVDMAVTAGAGAAGRRLRLAAALGIVFGLAALALHARERGRAPDPA